MNTFCSASRPAGPRVSATRAASSRADSTGGDLRGARRRPGDRGRAGPRGVAGRAELVEPAGHQIAGRGVPLGLAGVAGRGLAGLVGVEPRRFDRGGDLRRALGEQLDTPPRGCRRCASARACPTARRRARSRSRARRLWPPRPPARARWRRAGCRAARRCRALSSRPCSSAIWQILAIST